MAPTFLPALDLSQRPIRYAEFEQTWLSYVKSVFSPASTEAVPALLETIKDFLGVYHVHLDVTHLDEIDHVVALLDAGAARVFATPEQADALAQAENIDLNRIITAIGGREEPDFQDACKNLRSAFFYTAALDQAKLEEALKQRKHDDGPVYVLMNDTVEHADLAKAVAKAGAVPILPTNYLTFDQSMVPDRLDALDLIMARAVSDRPDGLFTTLVTDERGIALGLVYSSRASVKESLCSGKGVYQSRKRGLWYKGSTSGDVQELVSIDFDCDQDCLRFVVRQRGKGFCHLGTPTCFGDYKGLSRLQKTLQQRKATASSGSYTARLFNDPKLLNAKIKEEADELCEATDKDHIAFEAADLLYFAMTKFIAAGVSLEDVEKKLDAKSTKVKRRKGDAKPQYMTNGDHNPTQETKGTTSALTELQKPTQEQLKEAASIPKAPSDPTGINLQSSQISMRRYDTAIASSSTVGTALQRPSQRTSDKIMSIVKPIITTVQADGDAALMRYTSQFERAHLTSPLLCAPFPPELMQIPTRTRAAIDTAYSNIHKFHCAQLEKEPLVVETMPGITCTRFSRPIQRVGLYVPGGTAVLPSTALMLGIPALVAGCRTIVLATPPRSDGTVTPEIVYVAHRIGATCIVLAGGAQAVAAMAYGTESVPKVDKILGPGNQFVTAAKMVVSNDTSAAVGIDMPAGPSEVLVVADGEADPKFVAADLLSQAEHGTDSQVVLIAVALSREQLDAIDSELDAQARALPRVDVVRGAIAHSITLSVPTLEKAMELSNHYAPEHLILNLSPSLLDRAVEAVENAGSVFVGPYAPESVGDYAAGVNHALPTYGFARQYSGVGVASFQKWITSSRLSKEGLGNVGSAVVELARCEGLEAHARAVVVRGVCVDEKDKEVESS